MSLDTLSVTLKAALTYQATKTPSDLVPGTWGRNIVVGAVETALGTGAGKAQQIFVAERELAASTAELLKIGGDGAGVALSNPAGETVTFGKINGIFVFNKSTTGTLEVFGDGTNDPTTIVKAHGDAMLLRPGGFLALGVSADDATKYAVSTATWVLRVSNTDTNAATYGIVVFGE